MDIWPRCQSYKILDKVAYRHSTVILALCLKTKLLRCCGNKLLQNCFITKNDRIIKTVVSNTTVIHRGVLTSANYRNQGTLTDGEGSVH